MRCFLIVFTLIGFGGCAASLQDIGREPQMSPVGSGLQPGGNTYSDQWFPPPKRRQDQSLWDESRADLFADPRAKKVGDVVTVTIAINDSATFGNSTDRSLDSNASAGFNFNLDQYKTNDAGGITSQSTTQGQGTIDRSEKMQLSIAAVVSNVLPNGNMIVSGSQEVRVNYELRLLNIAGIVRPRDISKDNTISYDKIAEARISYGGRGRISEVQQPSWGQQIYDAIKPF
jgi:flagellar L-ring protein precursor FlgH